MSMDNQTEQEKRREYYAKYRAKNREKTRQYDNQYRLTPKRNKYNTIYQWKNRYGINFHCYDTLYEIYESTTTCNFCGGGFSINNLKCVDHDHSITDGTDNVRAILCSRCNVRDVLGLVDLPKTKTKSSQ